MRLRCPNCAGKIYDVEGRVPPSSRLRGDATPVEFPKHVTECCGGTITVTLEDLPTFQSPAYGTHGHTKIMNQRNAVESPFGTARDKGGLEPGTCKAARLEAHALSALMTFVVMNLQTTMDQEIKEVQQLLKRHRQQQAAHPQGADPLADDTEPIDSALEPADQAEPVDDTQPDEAELVEPVNEAEPPEAAPADEVEVVDEVDVGEAEQTDEAEPDEPAPAGEERPISDPQELPRAVTRRPNNSDGSVATGHKRPRPPP